MISHFINEPEHWRFRAKEARLLANQMNDSESRDAMMRGPCACSPSAAMMFVTSQLLCCGADWGQSQGSRSAAHVPER